MPKATENNIWDIYIWFTWLQIEKVNFGFSEEASIKYIYTSGLQKQIPTGS